MNDATYDSVGTMGNALSLQGDELYASLSAEHQRIAEIVFRGLATEESGRVYKRPAFVGQLVQLADTSVTELEIAIEPFVRSDLFVETVDREL